MRKLCIAAAMLLAVGSCTKKSAPTAAKEPAIDAKPLFSQFCERCHGATGVEGRAPNLAITNLTTGEIADVITNGHGHMPAFANKMNAKQIDAVAKFVSHLKK